MYVEAVADVTEPQHDQAIEQQGSRRGALGRLAAPALRLLKAEMLLDVMEGDFKRLAHGVPSEHVFGCCLLDGRVKRLYGSTTG